ncbi:vitamin K epoxide reductase family protein [Candidatus Wolfebacteria bacterium]|nr:vitamin K epoxide reductase family protein [Candidatus Wolfebacteria bacterium]
MTNLEISLNKPSTPIRKWLVWLFLLFSFIGFLDAGYLAVKYYLGTPINCSFFDGCEKVTTSQYAAILGIPVALLGAIYYLFIFILAVAYFDTKKEKILYFTARFVFVGFFVSLWFLYLQLFIIKAVCLYCIFSAITSIILFLLGLFVIKLQRK